MKKSQDFKAEMAPEAKIWTLALFMILVSQLYTKLFLFIVISFDQYFGVENAKTAEN